MSETRCQSCTMPIEAGPYCHHCTDDSGRLRPFAETFERFRQWTLREEPGLASADVDAKVLGFMATVPAWKNHPEVTKSRS